MKKTILVDCDGVVLNWEYAFDIFMEEHGFSKIPDANLHYDMASRYGIEKAQVKKLIRIFNESAAIAYLPALRDPSTFTYFFSISKKSCINKSPIN